MFHRVLNTMVIVRKISYTLWITSFILSHPPSLLGQCPKFDRIFFLMASLRVNQSLSASSFVKNETLKLNEHDMNMGCMK
jgi:hypothetical protein